jgi:hypothetical protein
LSDQLRHGHPEGFGHGLQSTPFIPVGAGKW